MPLTGFLLREWQVHATSIWSTGFESWRENVEIKAWDDSCLGKALSFGAVGPAKGYGRLSILYFAAIYTYLEVQSSWDPDTEAEFKKPLGCTKHLWGFLSKLVHMGFPC